MQKNKNILLTAAILAALGASPAAMALVPTPNPDLDTSRADYIESLKQPDPTVKYNAVKALSTVVDELVLKGSTDTQVQQLKGALDMFKMEVDAAQGALDAVNGKQGLKAQADKASAALAAAKATGSPVDAAIIETNNAAQQAYANGLAKIAAAQKKLVAGFSMPEMILFSTPDGVKIQDKDTLEQTAVIAAMQTNEKLKAAQAKLLIAATASYPDQMAQAAAQNAALKVLKRAAIADAEAQKNAATVFPTIAADAAIKERRANNIAKTSSTLLAASQAAVAAKNNGNTAALAAAMTNVVSALKNPNTTKLVDRPAKNLFSSITSEQSQIANDTAKTADSDALKAAQDALLAALTNSDSKAQKLQLKTLTALKNAEKTDAALKTALGDTAGAADATTAMKAAEDVLSKSTAAQTASDAVKMAKNEADAANAALKTAQKALAMAADDAAKAKALADVQDAATKATTADKTLAAKQTKLVTAQKDLATALTNADVGKLMLKADADTLASKAAATKNL